MQHRDGDQGFEHLCSTPVREKLDRRSLGMKANTSNSARYTEPETLSRLTTYSPSERSCSHHRKPQFSAQPSATNANSPGDGFRRGAMSGKRRRTNPAAKKITVAMIGISASSAQRSPHARHEERHPDNAQQNPVPITMAK
jgi:hypothetical protein